MDIKPISERTLKEVFNPSMIFQMQLISFVFNKKYSQFGVEGEMPPELNGKIEYIQSKYPAIQSIINKIENIITLRNISTTEEYIRVNFLKHGSILGIPELELDIQAKQRNEFIEDIYEIIQYD